jgi:Zn-dependent protease
MTPIPATENELLPMSSDPGWDRVAPNIHEADYRVAEDGSIQRTAPPRKRGILAPLTAALVFIGTKLKFVLLALKGFPALMTGATALLSIGVYAWAFNWQFAVGLVVLLFIHEMGHVAVLRRYGVPATAPVFVPFMGAFIGMKQLPRNAIMEAYVGLGGPVIGSLGAMAAWGLYEFSGERIFLITAYVGVVLNLFNLLPVLPLDGGRIAGAISRWIWVGGYVCALGLLFLWHSPLLFILVVIGATELWGSFRRGRGTDDYYVVPLGDRLSVAALYFGLMAVLAFATYELQTLIVMYRP